MNEQPEGKWTDLFRAFRLTLDHRKLWLAFKGVVLSLILVGILLVLLASLYQALGRSYTMPATTRAVLLPASARPLVRETAPDVWGQLRRGSLGAAIQATCLFLKALGREACVSACTIAARPDLGVYGRLVALWSSPVGDSMVFAGLSALVLLFIWSYYGGAIMRIAAVEYALGERIELASASAYAWRKHQSFYGPPLGLAVGIFIIAVLIAIAGLAAWNLVIVLVALVGLVAVAVAAGVVRDRKRSGKLGLAVGLGGLVALAVVVWLLVWLGVRVPYVNEVVVGIFTPLALLGGFVAAIMAVWLVFGAPLMAGTIAASDTGVFDAWSRSFHYLFVHPWRYLFYLVVAGAHGAACLAFVYAVREGTEWLTFLPLSVGPLLAGEALAARTFEFFLAVCRLLLDLAFLSFAASYLFSALAVIYALMRQRVDGTPVSEVHLEPRDREFLGPLASPAASE